MIDANTIVMGVVGAMLIGGFLSRARISFKTLLIIVVAGSVIGLVYASNPPYSAVIEISIVGGMITWIVT